jgi:predicted thioesterase
VLEPGLSAVVEEIVTDSDTAVALGSGDVEVLGTPRVLALLEAATVASLAGALDPALTTVGTRVELDHLAPSPVGATVRAGAELVEVAGGRLTFQVRMSQAGRDVARGRVVRAVVDRDRFASRR